MRVLRGRSFSQNLKVQRSVGRAKDGTTFPLSLKLKHKPSSEEAEAGQAAPEQGYLASVWVFFTISGLITLLPDGTIYGINHSFALMLFGYGRTELLGKVGPPCMAGSEPQGEAGPCPTARVCVGSRPCASTTSSPAAGFTEEHTGREGLPAHGPTPLLVFLDPTVSTLPPGPSAEPPQQRSLV